VPTSDIPGRCLPSIHTSVAVVYGKLKSENIISY